MSCDLVMIGVGGQGVLTIADLLVRSAFASMIPVTFSPTKGMAQRGGFVKGEVRIGRAGSGMRIPPAGADIVIAMERSEGLKGIPYVRPGGTFILYDEALIPAGVALGKDRYPERKEVLAAIRGSGADLLLIDPWSRPSFDGITVPANVFVLGAAVGIEPLLGTIDPSLVERAIEERWPGRADMNLAAFRAGRALS